MFIDTKLGKGELAYNPFKSCVIPRPIGWISTISKSGIVNVAPYSYFNAVADIPPVVMYASAHGGADRPVKDSLLNIEETGEFVVNIATYEMREKVNLSSQNLVHEISEAKEFDIELCPSQMVIPPRIKNSPIALECKFMRSLQLEVGGKETSSTIVFGHVIGIYIDDAVITDGKIDLLKIRPIARLGYDEYAVIDTIIKLVRS